LRSIKKLLDQLKLQCSKGAFVQREGRLSPDREETTMYSHLVVSVPTSAPC